MWQLGTVKLKVPEPDWKNGILVKNFMSFISVSIAFQVRIWILYAVSWHGINFNATLKWNYQTLMQVLCQITGLKWLRVKKVVILKSLDEFML